MIDIGANLTNSSFSEDLHEVIQSAKEEGLTSILLTGTDIPSSESAQQLAIQYPNLLYSTAGIHPHHADEAPEGWQTRIRELAKLKQVVAIGETGLDYYRNFSGREEQRNVFIEQLQISAQLEMPLFIHDRESNGDMHELLKQHLNAPAVVHCFTGTRAELIHYLDLGCYIGITGWVCDERRGQPLASLIKDIPLDRLLIETDSPYLMPRNIEPRPKTRRNEPKYLPYVAHKIASLLGKTDETIGRITAENAKTLFGLKHLT